jgi:5-methylcytosine-specific restriction endonuclease McrA
MNELERAALEARCAKIGEGRRGKSSSHRGNPVKKKARKKTAQKKHEYIDLRTEINGMPPALQGSRLLYVAEKPRGLSREKKDIVLKSFGYTCAYCCDDATEVDHIIPFCYSFDDSFDNLVASCHFCNALAYSKVFNSFKEKRAYLLEKKTIKFLKKPIYVWLTSEINQLGYTLRSKIIPEVVIVETDDEANRLVEMMAKQGYTVYLR